MREIAAMFIATNSRIDQRIGDNPDETKLIIEDELRGLYHGLFVAFDGGTSLADDGLIHIVDEHGETFDRFLHEQCFSYWPKSAG